MGYDWRPDITHARPVVTDGTPASPTCVVRSTENVVVWLDAVDLLLDSSAPSTPRSTLEEQPSRYVSLADTPVVAGTEIGQRLRNLRPGMNYRLSVTFATNGQDRTMTLIVYCPL